MDIAHFFDPRTSSFTYVVSDPESRQAVVIDPVLDYDPKSGRIWHESAEKVADHLEREGLEVPYVLDTHVHADHITALPWFRDRFSARTCVGAGIVDVQKTWKPIFNFGDDFPTDGSPYHVLLDDGQRLEFGGLVIEALLTEGHTPASLTYRIGDALFVGDLLFMPDQGTARCDFPGGSAAVMYDAVHRLYELPDETRLFTLHDYRPGGRELRWQSTIGEEKRDNVHIHAGVTKDEFVAKRAELEKGKEMPTLLFPAVQLNLRGGELPPPESNGTRYLKIPIDRFGGS